MIIIDRLHILAGTFSLLDISFKMNRGAYAVLMGRTGTGKTTILESICGLRRIEQGRILLDGVDVTAMKPAQRGIGLVPQDAVLFTTMSVYDHLAFALVVRKWDRGAIKKRVDELAQLLGITHLLQRKPHGLSGGEAQRVALGRALVAKPAILCLDEPLSALDDETRREMYHLLKSVQQHTGVTTLHVTHNLAETRHLADHLFIIDDGHIRSAPIDAISQPAPDVPSS